MSLKILLPHFAIMLYLAKSDSWLDKILQSDDEYTSLGKYIGFH